MNAGARNNEFAQPTGNDSSMNEERMAVLLNLDVSSSVSPNGLRAIERNVSHFRDVVCSDGRAARCVDVAVITFADHVTTVVDWCNVRDMPDIHLASEGLTDLNSGCLMGAEMLRDRGRLYGDMGLTAKKPYLITMTDGFHTVGGDVGPAAEFISEREAGGKLKHWFLGLEGYDRKAAAHLTKASGCRVFEIDGDAQWSFDFFDFAANSVKAASVSAPGERLHVETPIATGGSPVKAVSVEDFLNE